MDDASILVAPTGMKVAAPGLGGGTTGVSKRVAYMVGERVSNRWPSLTHPRLV